LGRQNLDNMTKEQRKMWNEAQARKRAAGNVKIEAGKVSNERHMWCPAGVECYSRTGVGRAGWAPSGRAAEAQGRVDHDP
jgi:lysozyme family protein